MRRRRLYIYYKYLDQKVHGIYSENMKYKIIYQNWYYPLQSNLHQLQSTGDFDFSSSSLLLKRIARSADSIEQKGIVGSQVNLV